MSLIFSEELGDATEPYQRASVPPCGATPSWFSLGRQRREDVAHS